MIRKSTEPSPQPHTGQPPLSIASAGKIIASLNLRTAHPDEPEQSFHLPGYTIEHTLGRGGGGTVYYATANASGQPVAIKVLRSVSLTAVRRATAELEILSQARLHCVPRLLDFGIAGTQLYLVTEFVLGEPIDRHARTAHLDVRKQAALLADVADTLQAVHERAIIHRDIKPSNILIGSTGRPPALASTPVPDAAAPEVAGPHQPPPMRPWIIDFGIAALRSLDGADHNPTLATLDGLPIGTPAFMAPEVARGGSATTRSDIYSLGAVAFELLTGSPPLPANADESPLAHIHRVAVTPARDPRTLNPSLPKPLAAILSKACELDPARRYASAADLAQDLRRFLRGHPVDAQPMGPLRKAVRWGMAHPVVTSVAASVAMPVFVFAGSAAVTWYIRQEPGQVEFVGNNAFALVRSLDGNVLSTVGSGDAGSVVCAAVVTRPLRLGGGKVLVGMWNDRGMRNPLRIVEPTNPAHVLWRAPTTCPTPVPLQKYGPTLGMRGMCAIIADLLPDPPGEEGTVEVAEVQAHVDFSPCVMRVYDLAGNVKFEAWHDGWLSALAWLPANETQSGTLFAAGVCDSARLIGTPEMSGAKKLASRSACVLGMDLASVETGGRSLPFVITPPAVDTSVALPCAREDVSAGDLWLSSGAVSEVHAFASGAARTPKAKLKFYRFVQPWSVSAWVFSQSLVLSKSPHYSGQAVRLVMLPQPDVTADPACPLREETWLTIDRCGRVLPDSRSGAPAKRSPEMR